MTVIKVISWNRLSVEKAKVKDHYSAYLVLMMIVELRSLCGTTPRWVRLLNDPVSLIIMALTSMI